VAALAPPEVPRDSFVCWRVLRTLRHFKKWTPRRGSRRVDKVTFEWARESLLVLAGCSIRIWRGCPSGASQKNTI